MHAYQTLRSNKITITGLSLIALLLVSGCLSAPTVEERRQNIDDLARQSGWHATTLSPSPYPLRAVLPDQVRPGDVLSIYIEGDGLAWRSRRRISSNPTPVKPMALQLALLDQGTAAYLARPCQYVNKQSGCDPVLWTSARFSEDTIASTNAAIDLLKQQFSANQVRLIGYSGGGAVATLVAARRDDVSQLVTVAGNLDHVAWTSHHNVSPLTNSLNPADAWPTLQYIPQVHLVGESDYNTGVFVANSYRQRFPPEHQPLIRIVEGADHSCCWVDKWPELLKSIKTVQ